MSKNHLRDELDALGARFSARGYRWSTRCFFSDIGITISSQPYQVDVDIGDLRTISIIDESVTVYWTNEGAWEARLCTHGGPHWVKQASSIDELEALALEALPLHPGPYEPPAPGWYDADGREETSR